MSDEPQFNLPEMTPEQEQRANLFHELSALLWRYRVDDYTYWKVLQGGLIWLAIVDWNGVIDLELLMKNDLLVQDKDHVYVPDGSWRDRFPEYAYRLTNKAQLILKDYGRWIWTGEIRGLK
jgi:hypothetical protein